LKINLFVYEYEQVVSQLLQLLQLNIFYINGRFFRGLFPFFFIKKIKLYSANMIDQYVIDKYARSTYCFDQEETAWLILFHVGYTGYKFMKAADYMDIYERISTLLSQY